MAKVGFWLRGARGKMGGAVLMKSENGTVARENVTPKNPRTSKQMYQRAIFATVASAAKAMKEIINHSFYGIADGNKCIQEFRRINLAKLRNKVAANIAGNLDLTDTVGALAPKDYKFIVPNEYQISSGTLTSPALKTSLSSGLVKISCPEASIVSGQTTAQELVFKVFGVNPGEQLTVCTIKAGMGEIIYATPGDGATNPWNQCHENSFEAKRIVFMDSSEEEWQTVINVTDTTTAAFVFNKMLDLIDPVKSDMTLVDDLRGNSEFSYNESVSHFSIDYNMSDEVRAAGIVRSKYLNGQWDYSTCIMTCGVPRSLAPYGCSPEDAVASYMNGVTVGENNDPFLDEGGNGGSLE